MDRADLENAVLALAEELRKVWGERAWLREQVRRPAGGCIGLGWTVHFQEEVSDALRLADALSKERLEAAWSEALKRAHAA